MSAHFGDSRLPNRFWAKVQLGPGGCWDWTAGLHHGYGWFWFTGRTQFAYRVAYESLVGQIPAGLQPDHTCRRRVCVNPMHLDPVTQRVNILRGDGLPAQFARRDSCGKGHEYTPENTYLFRGTIRQCRTCKREWEAAARARRAVAVQNWGEDAEHD